MREHITGANPAAPLVALGCLARGWHPIGKTITGADAMADIGWMGAAATTAVMPARGSR